MQLRIPFMDGLSLGRRSGLALVLFIAAPAGTA